MATRPSAAALIAARSGASVIIADENPAFAASLAGAAARVEDMPADQWAAGVVSELAALPVPPLCADVLAWKQSGFQTISPTVLSLVSRVEAIELKPVSPRLLAPYARGADASLLARTKPLEQKVAENEFMLGQTDWEQVLETLGVPE